MIWIFLLITVLGMIWISTSPNTFPLFNQYTEFKGEHQKQQWVRLLDILVLGPAAFILACQLYKIGWKGWSIALGLYATGTMIYNFGNYRLNKL